MVKRRPNCSVSFQRFDASVRNGLNEIVGEYAEFYSCKSYKYDLSEREKDLAGHAGRLRVARFVFRLCPEIRSVDLTDRIVSQNLNWEILGARDLLDAGRGRVEFTASAEINRREV